MLYVPLNSAIMTEFVVENEIERDLAITWLLCSYLRWRISGEYQKRTRSD